MKPTQFASYTVPSKLYPGSMRPYVETPTALYSGPEQVTKSLAEYHIQKMQDYANGSKAMDVMQLENTPDGKPHYRVF